jgi:cytochrome c oxidase cbb3-type subunit 1
MPRARREERAPVKIPVGIPVFVAAAGTDPRFARLIHRWLFSAVFWLLVGGAMGLIAAYRHVDPEFLGDSALLTYGRLRPVHTLCVLFGWASMALVALALYVVPKCSRITIDEREMRTSNVALWLWNAGVVGGMVALLIGQINGGREYREIPLWAMSLIAAGVLTLLWTFYRMIARRQTKGIYISCWFILAACGWIAVVAVMGYTPLFKRGVADTIVSGFYMHNAVGMWFTPMVVGPTYYTLPKLLNKPIYSYALGVLGIFTHLLFYTLIGTHHYMFSAIPDWLENLALIFSVAMMVPVFASAGNFLLTMKGEKVAIQQSYSLPFLLVGVIGYIVSSAQGSYQALRVVQDNLHLTHYTVGHSHLGFYFFVSFLLWGSIYGLVPRITGREPPVRLVGAHYWLAFAGGMIMVVSLCLGGAEQGATGVEGKPFMDGVRAVQPYMVWRVVGGCLMVAAHLLSAVAIYAMRPGALLDIFGTPATQPPPPESATEGRA